MIYSELARAQDNLVLANELHLLYLVTPHDLRDSPQPEWMVYYKQVSGSSFRCSVESIIRLYMLNAIRYTLFNWLKYHAPPSNQSNAKLTGIATWLPAFSRAGHKSRVLTLNSHWFLRILPFPLVGRLWLLWFFLLDALYRKLLWWNFIPWLKKLFQKDCSSWRTLCSMLFQNIFETLFPKKINEPKVTCLEEFYRRLTVVVVSPLGIFISWRVRGKSRWTFGSNRKFFIQKSHRTAIENGKWSSYWIAQGSWVLITFYFISLTSMARHGAVSFLFFLWNFDLGFVLVIEMMRCFPSCQNQDFLENLQTVTQARRSRCFKSVYLFW